MLLLAMSCLQGRPMSEAARELLDLEPDGLQLTPGNLPTADFAAFANGVTTLRHHGFSFTARRQPVWADDGVCLVDNDSVHPPQSNTPAAAPATRQAQLLRTTA